MTTVNLIPTKLAMHSSLNTNGLGIAFGAWCFEFGEDIERSNDVLICPYHWDDREKMFADYQKITTIYEDLLLALAQDLNKTHRVTFPLRYWRILIGPWLACFVQIMFDRYAVTLRAVSQRSKNEPFYFDITNHGYVANDMKDFSNIVDTDAWNQSMFQTILQTLDVNQKPNIGSQEITFCAPKLKRRATLLKKILGWLSKLVFKKNDLFFISTYLSVKDLITTQLYLRQIPTFWFRQEADSYEFNPLMRDRSLPFKENSSPLEKIICKVVYQHMPRIYLEGYEKANELVEKIFPRKASVIFDCNSWNTDDLTKAWVAKQVLKGARFVIGQHGGNYGQSKWNFSEDHQLAICDRFLTWGLGHPSNNKVTPVGVHKLFGRAKPKPLKNGHLLLAQMGIPRYCQSTYAVPVSISQWQTYFDQQCDFVEALDGEAKDQLLIRLYPNDNGLQQEDRWKKKFPQICLDRGQKQSFLSALRSSRLYVCSYSATTYLETIALNYPTIMFWDPTYWEMNNEAEQQLLNMEKVGLFHRDPNSAAKKVLEIWDDIEGWWYGKDVQEQLEGFRRSFCLLNASQSNVFKAVLRSLKNGQPLPNTEANPH